MSVLTPNNPGFSGNLDVDQIIILTLPLKQLMDLRMSDENIKYITNKDSFWRDRVVALYGRDTANAKPPYDSYRMQDFVLENAFKSFDNKYGEIPIDLDFNGVMDYLIEKYDRSDIIIAKINELKKQDLDIFATNQYKIRIPESKELIDWLISNGYTNLIAYYNTEEAFSNDTLRKIAFQKYLDNPNMGSNFDKLFSLGNIEYVKELLSIGYIPDDEDLYQLFKKDHIDILNLLIKRFDDSIIRRIMRNRSTWYSIVFYSDKCKKLLFDLGVLNNQSILNDAANAAMEINDKNLLLSLTEMGANLSNEVLARKYVSAEYEHFNWLIDHKFFITTQEDIDYAVDLLNYENKDSEYRLVKMFESNMLPSQEKLNSMIDSMDNPIRLLGTLKRKGMAPTKYPNNKFVRDWMWENGLLDE